MNSTIESESTNAKNTINDRLTKNHELLLKIERDVNHESLMRMRKIELDFSEKLDASHAIRDTKIEKIEKKMSQFYSALKHFQSELIEIMSCANVPTQTTTEDLTFSTPNPDEIKIGK